MQLPAILRGPHGFACPIIVPDWYNFLTSVECLKIHRQTKGAIVLCEDEKYCYLAMSKKPVQKNYTRILLQPKKSSGKIDLKLCLLSGGMQS